jgi:gamma-glutamyltranspeptidase
VTQLRAIGHQIAEPKPISGKFGGGQIILVDDEGETYLGGSDPRKDGCALCY